MAPKRSGGGVHQRHRVKDTASANSQGDNNNPANNNNSKLIDSPVDTLEGDTTASLKQATWELAEKVMVIEERTIFLGDLISIGRGTREVEGYVRKQEKLRHELPENVSHDEREMMVGREREAVLKMMENKLTDYILKGVRRGR